VPQAPSVVVFDVNETLSDMAALDARFEQVGAPPHLRATWFASVLRDGFGLAAAGAARPFAEIAAGVLAPVLSQAGVADVAAAVEHVMAGMQELEVHEDVPEGVRALGAAGLTLVTLTNGATATTDALLTRAGVREVFDRLLSVEDAGVWKPARAAYDHAVRETGQPAGELLLVAVHPWDIDGARRAGLRTAWIDRCGGRYPGHLLAPELTATSIGDLAEQLTA
jgi:2-haloacid dehalogenase